MGKWRWRSCRTRGSTEEGSGGCQSTLPVFICTFRIFKTFHCPAHWSPDWKRKGFPQQFLTYLFTSLPPLPTTNVTQQPLLRRRRIIPTWALGQQHRKAELSPALPILSIPPCSACSQNRQELEDQWERGRSQLGTLWGAAWEPLNSLCCHGLTFTALSYGKKQMRQQIEQFGSVSAIKQKSWISLTRAIAFLLLPSPALKDHRQAEIYKIQQLQ